jgi:hypothetical protein
MKKILKLVSFLVMSLVVLSVHAQSEDSTETKRKIYEELIQSIQTQEEKAQYSGDDPVIRQRLSLPPKLPSFEEWMSEKVSVEPKPKAAENDSPVQQIISSDNTSAPIMNEVKQEKQLSPVESKGLPNFPYTAIDTYIIASVNSILILFNFILYALFPSIRKITIAPPFDIGVRGEKSDAENNVKVKRYITEIILLLAMGSITYLFYTNGKINNNEDYVGVAIESTIKFSILFVSYLIARFIFGFTSKCPRCKTPFAAKRTSTHEEPKSTYQKRVGGGSSQVDTWETGVQVSEYMCSNCNHSWNKKKTYKKRIDTHH